MTAPTAAPPLAPVDPPPARPAGYGLLAAATVRPAPTRLLGGGVEWQPAPCTPALPYPAPCANTTPGPKTFYDAEDRRDATPFIVYWGTECGTIGADTTDSLVRAGLAQGEGRAVEAEVWTLLDAATNNGAARGLVDAVGHLEEELANRVGALGLIHAPRRVAAYATHLNLVRWEGAVPRTPGGHAWVFGAGYDPLRGNPPTDGVRLVATGPTTLWQGAVTTVGPIFDHHTNRFLALAEREYAVGWDCAAVAMTTPLNA